MTAPIIYFAGGEDCDHVGFGSWSISTNTSQFRSTYARCGLSVNNNTSWVQNIASYAGSPTTFWWSAQIASNNSGGSATLLQFTDSLGFVRLQIGWNSTGMGVWKVSTAGTYTLLANTLAPWTGVFHGNTSGPDKIDIRWVNAVSGSFDVYQNLVHVYSYSGDTTTETTAITNHKLWNPSNSGSPWSEIIVCDTDTRSWNLQTLPPVANGNTHNFDTGTPAAANVNETTLSDATLDGSTTAGQIDQYTLPTIASGTYTIIAIGVSARLQKGSSGPTKMDLGVRVSGSDYWSSDQSLTLAWGNYQNWWTADPSTSVTWTGLPTNVGLKSVA